MKNIRQHFHTNDHVKENIKKYEPCELPDMFNLFLLSYLKNLDVHIEILASSDVLSLSSFFKAEDNIYCILHLTSNI